MKLNEVYKAAKESGNESVCRFMRDMKKAGLKTRYYGGRNFYKGPAVVVSNIQDALSATKVPCTWDNMGRDFVVHPKRGL